MAETIQDHVPSSEGGIEKLFEFLETRSMCLSIQEQQWAKDYWFQPQCVTDRVTVLQKEAGVRSGKGKGNSCVTLGAVLVTVVEQREQRYCRGKNRGKNRRR